MAYRVKLLPSAARDLKRLDGSIRPRIVSAIDGLGADPRPSGVKKLVGEENLWRVRIGDYRILYRIHDRDLEVLIVGLGHRKDIYR